MDQMTNRLPPNFVWPTVGHPGMVPLWALVPTPNQPRDYIDPDELKELAETMKKENGGEQREIMTVRALSPDEMKCWAPARYVIKSGERRWRAAALAGLDTVEIRVKKYATVAAEKLDTFMLNEGRVGLSDIENAIAIADLMQEHKLETQEQLAKLIGKDQFWVSQHLALLKLSPSARALMSPKIVERERLKREVGVYLSRLSYETQERLIPDMPKGRVPASQQIGWLQAQLKGTAEEQKPVRHKPSTMRQVLHYFANQVERRAAELMAFEGFDDLFANATPKQVSELLGRLRKAQADMDSLVVRVEVRSGRPAKPLPVRQAPPVKVAADPVLPEAPVEPRAQHRDVEPDVKAKATRFVQARDQPVAATSAGGGSKEKAVSYYDDAVQRIVNRPVTQARYIQLFEAKKLAFQQQDIDRPSWMPNLDEAKNNWDHYCRK